MAPEVLKTMETAELSDLARKIRDWQKAQTPELSDTAMLKRFPDLGSTKTYTRILNDDFAEMDIERQLACYRSEWAAIEGHLAAGADSEEEIYKDLGPAVKLATAFVRIIREQSSKRCIFLIGPSGSGKTGAVLSLAGKYGSRIVIVEATEAWNDSPGALLSAIGDALGLKGLPYVASERLKVIVEFLNESPRCLVIEEAHHCGPRCLDTIKTVLNKTPCQVVVSAYDTLWSRLERGRAYEQAAQLTGHRLAARIVLQAKPDERDITIMVERRLGLGKDDLAVVAQRITEHSPRFGRLGFARDVIAAAREAAGKESVTRADALTAIETVSKRR